MIWLASRCRWVSADALFNTTAGSQSFYTDFELTGPNVGSGSSSGNNPSGASSSFVNSNTVNVSWTPAAGSDGSVVLIKNGGIPNRTKPINGITYPASPDFKSPTNLFGGGARIVFAGAGNNVDITGLGGSNNTYAVSVFSYTGSGPTISYGLNPATNNFPGSWRNSGSFFGAPTSTNIPARWYCSR